MTIIALSKWVDTLESGARPKGGIKEGQGNIPSLGAEHLSEDGSFSFTKEKRIPVDFYTSLKKGRIAPNDILIVKDGATTGKVSFVNGDFPYQHAAINEHVFRLVVDTRRADPRFVFRYLQSPQGQVEIMRDFRGATVGGIGRTFVDKVFLPNFNLGEQQRISAILDKADNIRRKHEQTLEMANALLESAFLERFGNPVVNPRGWPMMPVGAVANCIVPGRDKPKSFTGDIPWITTNQLQHFNVTTEQEAVLFLSSQEITEVRARIIPANSVIITCVGDLGICSIAGAEMVINQQLHSFQCQDEVTPEFLCYALSFQKDYMLRRATKTTLPYMNKSVCNSIPVPVAPMNEQRRFSKIFQKIRRQSSKLERMLKVDRELISSISQRAFRGEL